jgi:hypothetical protein
MTVDNFLCIEEYCLLGCDAMDGMVAVTDVLKGKDVFRVEE